jgi:hypothetical protein
VTANPRSVACPTCGAQPHQACRTSSGAAASTHMPRIYAATPPPTPEEQAQRDRDQRRWETERSTSVRTTFVLSCDCVQPASEPIPRREHPVTTPGAVTSCEVHHEYAIVVEVRTRLVDDVDTLTRLYLAAGLDDYEAEELARDQAAQESPHHLDRDDDYTPAAINRDQEEDR